MPSLDGAPKRITQELARWKASREHSLHNLDVLAHQADERARDAQKLIALLRPDLQKWVDDGMPEDAAMEEAKGLYVRAMNALVDAQHAAIKARQVIADAKDGD